MFLSKQEPEKPREPTRDERVFEMLKKSLDDEFVKFLESEYTLSDGEKYPMHRYIGADQIIRWQILRNNK